MKRRQFLAIPALSLIGSASIAADQPHVAYTREVYEQALAGGEPFMLDFYASW